MNRLLILAALLLSVVGGLTLMSSSLPVAAQTEPSATRSFDPDTVAPDGTVTVTVAVTGITSAAGSVTETLPAGFTYVSTTHPLGANIAASGEIEFRFAAPGATIVYEVTASDTEDTHSFSGELNPGPGTTKVAVGGDTDVVVQTAPVQTGPQPAKNDLQFDIVSSKAVKDARVSGVGYAIATNALHWHIDETGFTFDGEDDFSVAVPGSSGFVVKRIGDGEFGLYVAESGASVSGDSDSISIELTYTRDADSVELTTNLTGDINDRDDLSVDDYAFTISQGIAPGTHIGAFEVDGGIDGEYLDGILSGTGSDMFSVDDSDMTLSFQSGSLSVWTYDLQLTVSGDAGLANRTTIADVEITVTASNMAPTVPSAFTATLKEENLPDNGLISAGATVGDASYGVSANDSDVLTYSLDSAGDAVFDINSSNGMITVEGAIADTAAGGTRSDSGTVNDDGDVVYTFNIMVSDGVTANQQTIPATVTVDVNSPAMFNDGADDDIARTLTAGEVPYILLDLRASVTDADGDSLTFSISNNPAHIVLDSSDTSDVLLLTYLPHDADPGPSTDTISVSVTDGYNGASDSIDIEISVSERQPDPVTSEFVSISVAENTSDCSQAGVASGCSLAGIVASATSYSIESGVEGGDTNYAVDSSTGAISVVNMPNFEDDESPAFLVNANNNEGDLAGLISVRVTVTDVNEAPVLDAIGGTPWVYETAQSGDAVVEKPADQDGPEATDPPIRIHADDQDDDSITYSISAGKPPFAVHPTTGALTVSGALDTEVAGSHTFTVKATDEHGLSDDMSITVHVLNANEAPNFTSPLGDAAVTTIPENTGSAAVIFVFTATDEDGDDLTFVLREGQSQDLFEVQNESSEMVNGVEVWSGELHVRSDGPGLDYENAEYDSRVHVEVNDPAGLNDTLLLRVNLQNLNDEAPTWDSAPSTALNLAENTSRGTVLANYSATDPDGLDAGISYSLSGAHADSFEIMSNGDLVTLESIDADSGTPCAGNVCNITVNASDGAQSLATDVRITVVDAEDSVSTLDIRKANPVPGPNAGLPDSALSGAKTTRSAAVQERPADLPATITSYDLDNDGTPDNVTNAVNFVETEWANWGTVLLIEITSESPDSDCGNGNQCVVVDLESDSADDKLSVIAYRSAHQENKFLAAVKLVGRSSSSGDGDADPAYLMPTEHRAAGGVRPRDMGATPGDSPVYKHTDGSVARIQVDEEDEISIAFDNLRDSVDVENDPPEIESFAPEHESAFDDADVDYSFRVTDGLSGIPSPEDLPDGDGDEDYIPVIAVVSGMQCERPEIDLGNNRTVRADVAQCNDKRGTHEYDATTASRDEWGYIAVREDKDFDDIDNGIEVETTLVLDEDKVFYVTFVAVDRAGNMTYFDPDGSDDDVEYAEIVIDVNEPELYEARAGVTWDEGDEEYDDDRSVIQVIFNDLTQLNPATVEIDDFVVEGHTVVAVNVYEQPDDWTDGSRYATGGELRYRNPDGLRLRQSIETSVFIHLEDELQADETPDVTLVPNGIEDVAGNEQDDGEAEADDWISPAFTIVSIVSPRETTENPDKVLAGDGDEVVFNVTVDERLNTARPTVTVSYVDASMVDTKGTATCDNDDGADKGKRKRGEVVMNTSGETSDDCADNGLATDHNLKTTIEKVTNTEWIITVGEPKGTGYYNFHIAGKDRSAQQNPGSEGVNPDKIVTDFFDSDGDVDTGDAVFFEGDINLPKPNVRLGGVSITDNEPSVEYRSRLFLEIDFTQRYEDAVACEDLPSLSDNYRLANCMNENSEYAEDSFDDIVVTSFVLDGVDITDSVRTTDKQTFLVTLENIGLGDHEVEIQAMDQAGNELEDALEIDFEVSDRDPFEKRLSPGWNLISLPGEPADSSIAAVFGAGVEVRTVYTYNPVVPGGWQVAVRETLDSEWQGDLTEITGQRGYWVLSDAIQDWEVNIPRLAGGAVGTGTPIQPPVIPLYAGWNLIPVTDVKGNALDHGTPIDAAVYLQSLEDGIEAARVLGFDTIRNEWYTVLDGDMMSPGMGTNLLIGSGYWVFVRNATALVPGGVAGSGGSSD
ncbi:MAG: cadherin domain-containing protein [Chloroflexota bacterium]|nr:cadherin domain-containing protein [Chloroflexota bacterium]